MKFITQITGIAIAVFFLCSCSSEADKAARGHVQSAETNFQTGNYQQVVSNITEALVLADNNFDGSWTFLRGRAYAALGQHEKALGDFDTSIKKGNEYLHSYALNSNPKFDAKRNFQKQLAGYHEEREKVQRQLQQKPSERQ